MKNMEILRIKTKKGQAAITDALFFLLIIVALSVLMFKYSSTYGDRIDKASYDLYYKEYTNSVLKTIFYTSTPLDFDLNLYSSLQNDYLMTQVKQDYYAHGKIGIGDINNLVKGDYLDLSKYNLFYTLKATMKPLESHDYLFYLYDSEDYNFVYFSIKNTNFTGTPQTAGNYGARGIMDYNLTADPYNYYLCDPDSYDDVRAIVSKSSKIFSSSIPLTFTYNFSTTNNIGYDEDRIIATFAMWPATVDINSTMLKDQLHCNEITESEIP